MSRYLHAKIRNSKTHVVWWAEMVRPGASSLVPLCKIFYGICFCIFLLLNQSMKLHYWNLENIPSCRSSVQPMLHSVCVASKRFSSVSIFPLILPESDLSYSQVKLDLCGWDLRHSVSTQSRKRSTIPVLDEPRRGHTWLSHPRLSWIRIRKATRSLIR